MHNLTKYDQPPTTVHQVIIAQLKQNINIISRMSDELVDVYLEIYAKAIHQK